MKDKSTKAMKKELHKMASQKRVKAGAKKVADNLECFKVGKPSDILKEFRKRLEAEVEKHSYNFDLAEDSKRYDVYKFCYDYDELERGLEIIEKQLEVFDLTAKAAKKIKMGKH